MTIQIIEVRSSRDLKNFIEFPERLHRNHKNWLHPLYVDEKKFFSKSKNPAFQENETILFLAFSGNKIAGRIMGIIPKAFNQKKGVHTARFSYLECIEDVTVFKALLNAVEKWAIAHNSNRLIGPMGFSDKEPQGFVTKGFHEKTMMVTNCSFEYMKIFSEKTGFTPFVELCQYEVPLNSEIIQRYIPITSRVLRNLRLHVKEFTSTKEIGPYVGDVFKLINATYTEIYGFTKVSEEEADEFAKRFLPLLNPKLIKLILDDRRKVVAFVIAMPDLSGAIRKSKGRLFPFGWFRILRAMKTSKRLVLLLGAVHPDMQNKGLNAVLAVRLIESALSLGFSMMDSHLIMKDNVKMRREIERLDGYRQYKEYTIYAKDI